MSTSSRSFLAVSMASLIVASVLHLGVLLGVAGAWAAMVHLTLFGWVTAMIYAITAHIVPVFAARSDPYPKLGLIQCGALGSGLVLVTLGLLGGNSALELSGLVAEVAATLAGAASVALLLRRGTPRQNRPLPPAIAGQREVDALGRRATRAASAALPLALLLLLSARAGWSSSAWLLAGEHLAALGWVMLTIVGVAYHMLPRFTGRATRGPRWARAQLRCHLLAVALMVPALGFGWRLAFAVAGLLMAAGIGLFAYTIWPTIGQQAIGRSPVTRNPSHSGTISLEERPQ